MHETYSSKSAAYRKGVLSGKIIACKQVKQLCTALESDFANQGKTSFPYYYDEEAAHRVCQIVELFGHVKGKLAARGERIHLESWQCNAICSIYGWKRKRDRLRRYRRATILLPKKQGKTLVFGGGLGIYHLLFDGETGAEVYCGASNLPQAKEVFSAAKQMLVNEPSLIEKCGVVISAMSIVVPATNSKFLPVISKAKDGYNVSFGICDEVHQMNDLSLYDSMVSATAAREQPLVIAISTAGFGTENPCKQLQDQAEQVLNGVYEDDELFPLLYGIDEGIDWKSDFALEMANPGCNVSVTLEFLRTQQKRAINVPSKAPEFKTKHLNITVGAKDGFYSLQKWEACRDDFTIEEFLGEPCWLGCDFSTKLDLTAISTIFRRQIDSHSHYYVFTDCFAPQEAVDNNPIYKQWAANELIHVCDGNTIDYKALETFILSRANDFKIQDIGFDPDEAIFFTQSLQPQLTQNIKLVEVPQRATHLSPPMKFLEELTYNKRIHHTGDPVLKFGVSNVIAKPFGNLVFPIKAKPENKIDPCVALIIALSRAYVAPITPPAPKPFYCATW